LIISVVGDSLLLRQGFCQFGGFLPHLLPASPCSCVQHRRELSQLKCEPAEYEFDAWCKDGPLRVQSGGMKRWGGGGRAKD
jgi:hypothetical protein